MRIFSIFHENGCRLKYLDPGRVILFLIAGIYKCSTRGQITHDKEFLKRKVL